MTGAADSVQAQLRERYASLTLKVGDAGTSADDLADAYGEMGKLFVAAEYLDAAESCFANAQALVPGDMRWPYYLGHVFRFRNEPAKAAAFFAQSLTLEPDHVPTLVWLGEMRLAQNRPDAAERLFTRALAIQSRSTAALYGLGRAALARQRVRAGGHPSGGGARARAAGRRASTIRWRWPTVDWAIAGTPTPTSASAATSRSRRPIRCWRRSPDC